MNPDWKKDISEAMRLQRLLEARRHELAGPVTEAVIDEALSDPDPLTRLRDLARAGEERQILNRALHRLETIITDLRARARVTERNAAKRARAR